MSDLSTVLLNPNWIPYEFDADYNNLTFIETDADKLRSAPFLDQRFISPSMRRQQFSVSDIARELDDVEMTPIPMIFHSAFCCSTLMASALDVPDHCLPLKEPQVLMSLANAKRILRQQNKPASQYNTRFAIVMKLLARKFRSTEQILLKPTNSVNNILEDTLSAGCPVTIMYASLEDFLISVLKKGEPCKSFIRTQFNIFTLDPCVLATIPHRQALTFTDLQIATLVWRHQMELFFKLKNAFPETLLLRDKKFLTNKLEALKSVSNVLNLNLSDKSLNAISVGSVFQRDSKFKDQELDGVQRAQDAKATKEKFSSELSHTLKWAENIRLEGDIFS